ncbi:hypothetical protein [Nostoc sp. LPT]|nr:hypothetical protein [Nostoc sp. LPT]MBN4005930.1 hypothetical protein [Nostoc sp. LPT]
MHQNHRLDQTREAINFLQEKATECDRLYLWRAIAAIELSGGFRQIRRS